MLEAGRPTNRGNISANASMVVVSFALKAGVKGNFGPGKFTLLDVAVGDLDNRTWRSVVQGHS